MGDKYLQEFGREIERETTISISGGRRQYNINIDLKRNRIGLRGLDYWAQDRNKCWKL